jgi:hypothetical protein
MICDQYRGKNTGPQCVNLTPGKYPKENIQVSEHGENLKSRIVRVLCFKYHLGTLWSACTDSSVNINTACHTKTSL